MADKKFTDLTALATPATGDLLAIVDIGSNVLKKITLANLAGLTELDVATHAALTATHGIATTIVGTTESQTLTNKTLTTPTINTPTIASPVLNTAISGTAFLDEDAMGSNSATKVASQQSIKAYVGTAAAALVLALIPSGTKMLFYQDVAPATGGWTIENTLDDKLVFVTKGNAAGGETGGQAHSTGSWTHGHAHSGSGTDGPSDAGTVVQSGSGTTVGSSGHAHAVTGLGVSDNTTWRPAAYNCIIAAKD